MLGLVVKELIELTVDLGKLRFFGGNFNVRFSFQ